MTEFFKTLMGRKFYEIDVPRIAQALERIAVALEKGTAAKPVFPEEQRVKVNIHTSDPRTTWDLVDAPEGVVVSCDVLEALPDEDASAEPCADCGARDPNASVTHVCRACIAKREG